MAEYNNLIYEKKKNHVARLTIQRPHVLNAVDYTLILELKKAATEISADQEVRVVIITGSGEKGDGCFLETEERGSDEGEN